jgi:hypothetical protein
VVKRHHFRGGEGTHGSMFHRAPGSIGASSFPSRVFPGMRMGGHMGDEQVTVRNLEIVEVDTEDNVLVVKGAVPVPTAATSWCGGRKEVSHAERRRIDLNNQKVGEVELADAVFGAEVNEALLYEAVRHYLAGKRARHAQDQDAARSGRLGQEAVEAEGHRPRPHGFGAQPAVAARRHGPRTGAARLQLQAAAQDATGRAALGAFREAARRRAEGVSAFQLADHKTKS